MDERFNISLVEDLIFLHLEASAAETVIQQMAQKLVELGFVNPSYPEAVLAREHKFPTALPTPIPVSFPHTDVSHCLKPAIAVGVLQQPVPFGFMGNPEQKLDVRVVFMLSITQPEYQVKTLQRLVKIFQEEKNLEHLLKARTPQEAIELLRTLFTPDSSAESVNTTVNSAARVEITIRHKAGLHARPAALFVKTASQYACDIQVTRVDQPQKSANAKSILAILGLGVEQGNTIVIETKGEQCQEALQALVSLIEDGFSKGDEVNSE